MDKTLLVITIAAIFVATGECQLFPKFGTLDQAVQYIVHPNATPTAEMVQLALQHLITQQQRDHLTEFTPHFLQLSIDMGVHSNDTLDNQTTTEEVNKQTYQKGLRWLALRYKQRMDEEVQIQRQMLRQYIMQSLFQQKPLTVESMIEKMGLDIELPETMANLDLRKLDILRRLGRQNQQGGANVRQQMPMGGESPMGANMQSPMGANMQRQLQMALLGGGEGQMGSNMGQQMPMNEDNPMGGNFKRQLQMALLSNQFGNQMPMNGAPVGTNVDGSMFMGGRPMGPNMGGMMSMFGGQMRPNIGGQNPMGRLGNDMAMMAFLDKIGVFDMPGSFDLGNMQTLQLLGMMMNAGEGEGQMGGAYMGGPMMGGNFRGQMQGGGEGEGPAGGANQMGGGEGEGPMSGRGAFGQMMGGAMFRPPMNSGGEGEGGAGGANMMGGEGEGGAGRNNMMGGAFGPMMGGAMFRPPMNSGGEGEGGAGGANMMGGGEGEAQTSAPNMRGPLMRAMNLGRPMSAGGEA